MNNKEVSQACRGSPKRESPTGYATCFSLQFHKQFWVVPRRSQGKDMGSRLTSLLNIDNKIVLFSGTPCQVSGLRRYLKRDYENLYCLDIICHGVPSPMFWEKYANSIEEKYGGKISLINFRCKDKGWSQFGMKAKVGDAVLFEPKENNLYLYMFLRNYCLKDLVRRSVEETLNALLDKEADELVNAEKYERSSDRQGYRSGHYKRNLHTTAGEVELKVPKLKGVPFETAIIERYRRRESSVEEALIEMYLAGVSVRRVEDITEALWGTKVSPGTISNLNKKAYEHIETWRTRPLSGNYPYVYVDGVYLKRSWGGEIQNVSVLVAIGVSQDGCREILGAA